MQNERNPGYTEPPAGADLLKAQRRADAGTVTAPPSVFSPVKVLGFAAGLLLVLYALWPASRSPRPGGETRTVSQAPAGGAETVISGEAAPERIAPGSASGVQTENLTPPSGGLREEDDAPPLPGLLIPPPPTLETLSYTGPAQSPALIAKETSKDRADCKRGDMLKCMRLGMRYIAGRGVKKDAERGFSLINKACAGGVAEACTSQGIMQLTGYGTDQDAPAALALFDKACGAGDMYGCSMLGSNYIDGTYVKADIPRGLGLFAKACDAKLAKACYFLGLIYAEGKLVPRDAAQADLLLGKACGLNDKNSCQLQQQLQTLIIREKKGVISP